MITVFGEGLVDLVPATPDPMAPLVPALGGGPFNVAITAARMGGRVSFVSRLSEDHFGEQLVTRLNAEGVMTDHIARGVEPTTLAVTALNSDGSARYTFYVDGTADRFAEPDLHAPGLAATDIAVFGTLSLVLSPANHRYAAAAHELAARGALVALDPNIRPAFATEEHREFLRAMLPAVNLLKMSDEEVEFMGDVSQVPYCIITRGGEGLTLLKDGKEISAPAPKVEVADTIGAGDTVMGALVALIQAGAGDTPPKQYLDQLDEDGWLALLSQAGAAAAITVSRRGAQPPTAAEVAELLAN